MYAKDEQGQLKRLSRPEIIQQLKYIEKETESKLEVNLEYVYGQSCDYPYEWTQCCIPMVSLQSGPTVYKLQISENVECILQAGLIKRISPFTLLNAQDPWSYLVTWYELLDPQPMHGDHQDHTKQPYLIAGPGPSAE